MTGSVLLVEDDDELRDAIALVLRASGLEVVEAISGTQAVQTFAERGADVVVLDVMLPGMDGFEVCQELRRSSQVPILMVTARDSAADIVRGLEMGADDYVVKPFEAPVLLARIRAVLRRTNPASEGLVESGDLRLDTAGHQAWCGDRELQLTATEFKLLCELARHPGQVLTREMLLDRVWGYDYLGDSRLVDMAVKRLRDKIETGAESPRRITTVRGVGYRFERG